MIFPIILLYLAGGLHGIPLSLRCERIGQAISQSSLPVLKVSCEALASGNYELLGIEDLWTTAQREGKNLFGTPDLWRATGPQKTQDMLGQTTVGPWQITLSTARTYGTKHGVLDSWNDSKLIWYLEANPIVQAQLAADFIEDSYAQYEVRSPYAIQRYFWLDAFVKKEIGQGLWYDNVLTKDPAKRKQTGFYAKQVLLGSRYNPEGLLYWLYITGDHRAIRTTLDTWSVAGFKIVRSDLQFCSCSKQFQDFLQNQLH